MCTPIVSNLHPFNQRSLRIEDFIGSIELHADEFDGQRGATDSEFITVHAKRVQRHQNEAADCDGYQGKEADKEELSRFSWFGGGGSWIGIGHDMLSLSHTRSI